MLVPHSQVQATLTVREVLLKHLRYGVKSQDSSPTQGGGSTRGASVNVIVHFGSVGRLGASCVFFCLALSKAIKGCLFSEPSFFFSRTTTPYTNLPSTALYCSPGRCELPQAAVPHTARVLLDTITCSPRSALKALLVNTQLSPREWWSFHRLTKPPAPPLGTTQTLINN